MEGVDLNKHIKAILFMCKILGLSFGLGAAMLGLSILFGEVWSVIIIAGCFALVGMYFMALHITGGMD